MMNDKVGLKEKVNEARYMAHLSVTSPNGLTGSWNLLKHIHTKASLSARLAVGRTRRMTKKAVPSTAAHKKPNWAIRETTEVSLAAKCGSCIVVG